MTDIRTALREIANLSLGHSSPLTEHQQAVKRHVLGYAQYEKCGCFCGARDGWDWSTQDRHGFPMTLRLCTACGLLRTNPRPTAATLDRYYAEDYRLLYAGSFEGVWRRQVRMGGVLRPHVAPEWTVYDVGCGTGGLLAGIRGSVASVRGCDMYEPWVTKALSAGICVELGGASLLPQGKADLVIALHTLEHRPNLSAAFHELSIASDDGARLLAGVPTLETARTHYDSFDGYLSWAHLWHFTERTFSALLRVYGWDCAAMSNGVAWADKCSRDVPAQWDRQEASNTMRILCT